MKIKRTQNAIRNIFYGTLQKFVGILGPFIARTAIIYILGNEYVGLNSLFSSILSFMSLAELGIGSALVFSMYKPIAEDDVATINAIYALYKKLYRIIGWIILVVGLALIPFFPLLISGETPNDVNIYVLYSIYLFNTVISYWMFAYKQSLLTAYQRSDIISKRSLIISTLMYGVQIGALFIFHNYYFYIIWLPVSTIATNLANKIVVDKVFPQYHCEGKVSKELEVSIKKKVMALFGTKVNSIVLHSMDNIVISAFFGLSMVGKYGNYYYIMNSVVGFLAIIYSSLTAGVGNSLEVESKEKNYEDFLTLSFLNSWLTMFCSTCLLCLYQPFMRIWVKEANMFDDSMVILFVLYFYIYQIRRVVLTYKDAAGIWWQDRLRPYVTMLVNLILNIALCQIIGIHGIIISTIVSMIVSIPWENHTLFSTLFYSKSVDYMEKMCKYILATVFIIALTWCFSMLLTENILDLIVRLVVVCLLLPNLLWLLIFRSSEDWTRAKALVKKNILRKKKLI